MIKLLLSILYYTILYYTILYYTILYYTILYYTILYYYIVVTHENRPENFVCETAVSTQKMKI